jgi:quercetin dioxygenase-like cupin family protein
MRTIATVITAAGAALLASGAGFVVHAQAHTHTAQTAAEAKWGPAPPMLPPGAQIAVLSGDPTKAVAYSVRLKFPANYKIPAHAHPTDENVVITSGSVTFGLGDRLSTTAATNKLLQTGGYMLAPAGVHHFAYTGPQEATIVLFGQGPVDFTYVNPADDPRLAKDMK